MAGPRAVVIGAGVSGLTCAVALLEAGAQVLVRTAAAPLGTVSAVAGAMLGPVFGAPDDLTLAWGTESDRRFRALAADRASGVTVKRGRLLSAPELGPGLPPWAASVPGFAECTRSELPAGYPGGFWAELPFADMPRYLAWLVHRVGELGGRIEQTVVLDLVSAAELPDGRADIVVNCAGLGGRELADDDSVEPVWGQHVIVHAPELAEFVYVGGGTGEEGMGALPHPRGVLLGSARIRGRSDLVPDPEVTAGILRRCTEAVPELVGAPVIGIEVGLRPGRPSVRLERDAVDGVPVVHDYGHGGNGVQWSWGCARDVVALAVS